MPDRESRTNFDHRPCYQEALHPPTKSGRQWCRTNGPASRLGGNPQAVAPPPVPPVRPRDGTVAAEVRERRAAAARRYQPEHLQLLLVAQAPPVADDRYFYFSDVSQHDWLFRAVVRTLLPYAELARINKPSLLAQLRDRGVFLIDLKPDPIVNSRASLLELRPHVPALLHRVAELKPERIVLIKTDVYDAAYTSLADAGLPVSKVRIPFPSSGRQTEFAVAFARVLAGQQPTTSRTT